MALAEMSVDGPSREAKSACWTLQGERIGAEVEQERARKVREGLEREEAQLKRMLFSAPGVPKHPLSQQRVGIGLELMPFDGGRERGPVVNCKSRLTLCHAPRLFDFRLLRTFLCVQPFRQQTFRQQIDYHNRRVL